MELSCPAMMVVLLSNRDGGIVYCGASRTPACATHAIRGRELLRSQLWSAVIICPPERGGGRQFSGSGRGVRRHAVPTHMPQPASGHSERSAILLGASLTCAKGGLRR